MYVLLFFNTEKSRGMKRKQRNEEKGKGLKRKAED